MNLQQIQMCWRYQEQPGKSRLTLVGAVGALLVTVVAAVVVSVTGPVLWDAAAAVAFELHAGARVTAARFITVISTIVIYTQTGTVNSLTPRHKSSLISKYATEHHIVRWK